MDSFNGSTQRWQQHHNSTWQRYTFQLTYFKSCSTPSKKDSDIEESVDCCWWLPLSSSSIFAIASFKIETTWYLVAILLWSRWANLAGKVDLLLTSSCSRHRIEETGNTTTRRKQYKDTKRREWQYKQSITTQPRKRRHKKRNRWPEEEISTSVGLFDATKS